MNITKQINILKWAIYYIKEKYLLECRNDVFFKNRIRALEERIAVLNGKEGSASI